MIRPVLLALLLAGTAATAQAQDLVISGGPIYTGVAATPTAEVVQVRDGRIAYVGPAADAPDAAGLQSIDLGGSAMFPGFTDGHAHLDGIGWRELTLNLEGSTSVADAMARVNRLCELNVVEQVRHVCETTIVQDAWERKQSLAVHGLVYGLDDGRLRDLGTSVASADEVGQVYAEAVAGLAKDRPARGVARARPS